MRIYLFINYLRDICFSADYDKNGIKRKENPTNPVFPYRIRRKVCASLTVEAALVVPIVLFTVTAGLYFFMYLHDKAVLTYAAQKACLTAVYETDEEQMCKNAKEVYETEAADSLLGIWEIKSEIENDGEYIVLSSEAVSKILKVYVYSKLKLMPHGYM